MRMEHENRFNYNVIENIKTFDVSAVVSAFYYRTKPKFVTRPENYDFSQLMLVLDGEGTYTTEDAEYKLSPGMMFYRPAGKTSTYNWSTENAGLALISFVSHSEAMKAFEGAPIPLHEAESAILLDVVKTCTRICEPMKSYEHLRGMRFKAGTPKVVLGFISSSLERFLSILFCRLRGIDLLVDESQKVSVFLNSSQLVDELKAYLREHISERLTLAEICTRIGASQTTVTKKFRIETGSGLIEYFTALKVEEACRRIREESATFADIAEALGYSSSSYFSKVFKKETGMTPTEYSRYVSKRRIMK